MDSSTGRGSHSSSRRDVIEAICPSPTEHGLWIGPGRRIVIRGALAGITHGG